MIPDNIAPWWPPTRYERGLVKEIKPFSPTARTNQRRATRASERHQRRAGQRASRRLAHR